MPRARPITGLAGLAAVKLSVLAGHPQLFYHVVLATVALGLTQRRRNRAPPAI